MPVKIESIQIEKMRRFQAEMSLKIGHIITLIAGENATSKSTLLGMICQPFRFGNLKRKEITRSVYTDTYNGLDLNQFMTIPGKLFKSEYRDVFRMSKKFDNPTKDNPYVWRVNLNGDKIQHAKIKRDGLYIRSRPRGEGQPIRFVTGPGESHEKGEGNFPHPVIYLGLNRLAPLALCGEVNLDIPNNLTQDEQSWITQQYRKILVLIEEKPTTQYVRSDSKTKGDFLGPKGDYYDAESCSAGQDNLGQILTAILSFRRLHRDLGEKYQGGLLLIDEIDATLHPLAQENLIKMLVKECSEINIQIIATTHSQYLLKLAMTELRKHIHLLFLENSCGKIVQAHIDNYEQIEDKLQQRIRVKQKRKSVYKPTIFLEDETARDFLSYLIGKRIVNCFSVGSAGTIISMSAMNVPEFEKVIFVIDGDQQSLSKTKKSRLIVLPGSAHPEKVIFDYLYELSESDYFFKDMSKRSVFREFGDGPPSDTKQYKKWYTEHRNHFGINARKAFSRWGKDHKEEVAVFLSKFKRIITRNQILISPEMISRICKRHGLTGV